MKRARTLPRQPSTKGEAANRRSVARDALLVLALVALALLALTPDSVWAQEDPHAGEAGAGPNPLVFQTDLAIWTAVVFLLLFFVLWKYAWGPISGGLEKREARIQENIAAAQRQHEEAKALLVEYEQRLSGAAGEVREIIEEARRDAEHTQAEMIEKARQEAEALQERARVAIETAKDQALKELAERGADLAIGLAGKIIRNNLDRSAHAELIQDAVGKFVQARPSQN